MLYLGIVLAAFLFLALMFIVVRAVIGTYSAYRGDAVVVCPENNLPAGVAVDAAHAAVTAAVGASQLRLRECSRWPERQDCGQRCLRQIETAPEGCMVRNILEDWYRGKDCVLCGKPVGQIDWMQHKPALIDEDRHTFEWADVRAEEVPEILATCRPVCWTCHIAEDFRATHPEMVVDRNFKRSA